MGVLPNWKGSKQAMEVSAQMLIFVKVAELGSISAASRSIRQTPSAISKQVGHLEDHVGCRLFHRTRTGVSLTQEGQQFYEKCRAVAEKFQEAEEHISSYNTSPRGALRIASSVAFGKTQLIPTLPAFTELYPEISVSLELTDRSVELEEENFDLSINFAEQITNPNVITRKIMENERIICASPEYLKRYGSPKIFSDLANFNCLRTSNITGRNAWHAELNGEKFTVDASGNFAGNSADAVYIAALAGMGIARLSTYIVEDKIASGELVRLFPDYKQKHADIAVIYAAKRNLSSKVRVFIDFLAQQFS